MKRIRQGNGPVFAPEYTEDRLACGNKCQTLAFVTEMRVRKEAGSLGTTVGIGHFPFRISPALGSVGITNNGYTRVQRYTTGQHQRYNNE